MRDDEEVLAAALAETISLHERVKAGSAQPLLDAVEAIVGALKAGGTLLVCGNGGSAADAQHVAGELVVRFERNRRGLPALALTTDGCVMTATGNDFGFDRLFERQVEALGRPGDVLLAISTSGASPNIVAAIAAAAARGVRTVALTGRDGGEVGRAAEIHVNVPSGSTPRVQEVHRTLLHVLCDLVERACA